MQTELKVIVILSPSITVYTLFQIEDTQRVEQELQVENLSVRQKENKKWEYLKLEFCIFADTFCSPSSVQALFFL